MRPLNGVEKSPTTEAQHRDRRLHHKHGHEHKQYFKPGQWRPPTPQRQQQRQRGTRAENGDEEGEAAEEERGPKERVTKLLLILKWGGELTKLGENQARELGNSFRSILYPDVGCGGLLRLHR